MNGCLREHILSDSQILRGKPCIKGTRIPVALVLGYLAAGRNIAAIQREFPDLTSEDVAATSRLHAPRALTPTAPRTNLSP